MSLPHGIGKSKRVVAFVDPTRAQACLEAGAMMAGGEDMIKEVENANFTDFDVAIATPDMMRFVGKLGKMLGPKGLMPAPKAGTVTPNIEDAVKEYAAGKQEFRTDKGANVHTVIGKVSFEQRAAQGERRGHDRQDQGREARGRQGRLPEEGHAQGDDDARR